MMFRRHNYRSPRPQAEPAEGFGGVYWALKYRSLCSRRATESLITFFVGAIFSVLMLTGFITDVPPLALGIGLAINSCVALWTTVRYMDGWAKASNGLAEGPFKEDREMQRWLSEPE